MAVCNTLSWDPSLHIKRDPDQLTFIVPLNFIATTRSILHERYNKHFNTNGYSTTFTDETKQPVTFLTLPPTFNTLHSTAKFLPPDVHLCRAQVFQKGAKLITVTLYATTGTVLVQGKQCYEWRKQEYNALLVCVDAIYKATCGSTETLPNQQLRITDVDYVITPGRPSRSERHPTPFPRRRSKRLLALEPVAEVLDVIAGTPDRPDQTQDNHSTTAIASSASPGSPPHPTSSPISVAPVIVTSPSIISQPLDIVTSVIPLESTPSPHSSITIAHRPENTTTHNAQAPPHTSPTIHMATIQLISPALTITTYKPDRSECATMEIVPPPISPTIDDKATSIQTSNPVVNTTQSDTSEIPPPLAPSDQTTDPKLVICDPAAQTVTDHTQSLNLSSAQPTPTNPKQRNRARLLTSRRLQPRTRPVTLGQTNRALKLLQHQLSKVVSQIPHLRDLITDSTENAKTQVKTSMKTHVECKLKEHADSTAALSSRIRQLEAQTQCLKSQVGDLKKQLSEKKCNCAHPLGPPPTETITPSNPPKTVNTSLSPTTTKEKSPNGTLDLPRQTPSHSPSPPPSPSNDRSSASGPRQRLAQMIVDHRTTHLLLGDSVMKRVSPDLVLPSASRTCQNLGVSGLTLDDLTHWLRNIPSHRGVRSLTVHIGINTCVHDVITVAMWTELYKLLRKVFPNAQLFFSSIVPPKSHGTPFFKTVHVSCVHLSEMCKKEKARLIDNADTFITTRGLPKKAMYYDNLHPSRQGTAIMTSSIRQAMCPQPPSHRSPVSRQDKPTNSSLPHTPPGPSWASQLFSKRPPTSPAIRDDKPIRAPLRYTSSRSTHSSRLDEQRPRSSPIYNPVPTRESNYNRRFSRDPIRVNLHSRSSTNYQPSRTSHPHSTSYIPSLLSFPHSNRYLPQSSHTSHPSTWYPSSLPPNSLPQFSPPWEPMYQSVPNEHPFRYPMHPPTGRYTRW